MFLTQPCRTRNFGDNSAILAQAEITINVRPVTQTAHGTPASILHAKQLSIDAPLAMIS
jgi:hypothetical protein